MQLFWPAWYGFGGRQGQSMWEWCCMAGTTERWRRGFAPPSVCASEWWWVTCLLLAHGVEFKLCALLVLLRTIPSSTDVHGHSKCGSFLGKMLCSLHRIGPWRTLPRGSTAMAAASHFFTSLLRCSRVGFASRWEWPPSGQASDGTASIAQSSVARPHLS